MGTKGATAKLREKSLLAIDVEDVFGTYKETGQVTIPCETIDVGSNYNLIRRPDMNGSFFEQTPVAGNIDRPKTYRMKAYPGDELGYLINVLLGAATSSEIVASAYKHIWTLIEANLLQRSLCGEVSEGGLTADQYDGGYITQLVIAWAAGEPVTVEATIGYQGRGSGSAPAWVDKTVKAYMTSMAKIYYGADEILTDSGSITINPNILYPNFKSGSQETQEPVINGRPSVTATFEYNNEDQTFRTAYEAQTAAKFKFVATHTSNITGSTPYLFSVELPQAIIMEVPKKTGDSGPQKESISLEGFVGTSEEDNTTNLEIILHNGTAAYTARP